MDTLELIGQTGAEVLRQYRSNTDADGGTARFLLDQLNGDQVAAILRSILADAELKAAFHIQIPRTLVEGENLPEEVLTDEKTVHLRHATIDKFGLILASTNDDQGQSLQDITKLGATDLKEKVELWVSVASSGLNLPNEQIQQWKAALWGLQAAMQCSLEQFAAYIQQTRQRASSEGVPIVVALGWALPALKLPRDSSYFESIAEKSRTAKTKWQKQYQDAKTKRACFLAKESPTRKPIEEQELRVAFEKVKEDLTATVCTAIESFITSGAGWNDEAAHLAEFEWQQDNIRTIFSGIRTQKLDLIGTTKQFFQDEYPESLTESEVQYLDALKKRGLKEPRDEDQEFYERHRNELEAEKTLKTKWDKFVYGQPIECTDFLIGVVEAIERVFQQAPTDVLPRKLTISTHRPQSKKRWLDLNCHVGVYFCTRYRGLEKLTQPFINWDAGWLFKYDELVEQEKQKKKNNLSESIAKAATEIKFYVDLSVGTEGSANYEKAQTQIIWRCNPNAIGLELNDDLTRLSAKDKPLQLGTVSRELSNKKGRLQGLALADVGTLMGVFRQNKGSLVAAYKKESDLQQIITQNIKKAVKEGRLSQPNGDLVASKFSSFTADYLSALKKWLTEGISSLLLVNQVNSYEDLLDTVKKIAKGDGNRTEIIEPIMKVGCVFVERGDPAVIIPPWHPLRMAAIAIKARQVAGLIRHILAAPTVDFGDARLFFRDHKEELKHPYYPEITIGYKNRQPLLLATSDTTNDYSLLERPVRDHLSHETNEDPEYASDKLIGIIQKYLDLLPHERTNLSVALYNCDSIKLPQVMVNKLTDLSDDQQEARCQVILRHRDTEKLSDLYRQLVEVADSDPESFVASEVARDFIARLRIGVKADSIPTGDSKDGKFADIVFLQDVIARHAIEYWPPAPLSASPPKLIEHVPPRWSRKRPAANDDEKSVVYLVCPSQPTVGQAYLDLAYSVIKTEDVPTDEHFLPARQISFKNDATQNVLTEVHRLGEWVVNYDELVDRRQLVNQNIRVIRYQQSRTDKQNLIVSSNSQLNLLHVLVRRRLEYLHLQLNESDLASLTSRLIDDANALSGDIVLRAAKSGHFASELVGVALSKKLIESEFGQHNPIGWYFLDDYASWLGEKEGQIADILAMSPCVVDGNRILRVIISESKYVDASGLAEAKKTSQKQLRDTVERIVSALFLTPGRLDRDLWLSRLGDLLLTGIDIRSSSDIPIEQWRDAIRSGYVSIDVRGYSHIFISGPSDADIDCEQTPITKVENCIQEVFNRERVQQLVLAYHKDTSMTVVREQLGPHKPWEQSNPKPPAARVQWIANFASEQFESDTTSSPDNIDPEDGPGHDGGFDGGQGGPPDQTPPDEPPAKAKPVVTPAKPDETGWSNKDMLQWLAKTEQTAGSSAEDEAWLTKLVDSLTLALRSYNFQARVLGKRLTPNAALVRLKGSDLLTVEDVDKKTSQLLTTHGINVINVAGQPGEVIVSCGRPQRETLSLRNVWSRRKINRLDSGLNLSFVIGVKELDNEILYLNLAGPFEGQQQHAPHTLIAGATGSGKSVLVQNLLLDICATNSERLVGIYLIDPKFGVDYTHLEELPHLRGGIIVEQKKAIEVMEFLATEMERRYALFKEHKAKDLTSYNISVSTDARLPALFLVHDEFAEWMLIDEYKEAVSSAVQRIGVKARAAGIYLIFAAQRPDANVLPVQLRDNLGNRLILRVESIGTSEIALGQKGAERLLGRGHLAARLTNEPQLIFAQVPILTDSELVHVTQILSSKKAPVS